MSVESYVGVDGDNMELTEKIELLVSPNHKKIIKRYCEDNGYATPQSLIATLLNNVVNGNTPVNPPTPEIAAINTTTFTPPTIKKAVNPFEKEQPKKSFKVVKIVGLILLMVLGAVLYSYGKLFFHNLISKWNDRINQGEKGEKNKIVETSKAIDKAPPEPKAPQRLTDIEISQDRLDEILEEKLQAALLKAEEERQSKLFRPDNQPLDESNDTQQFASFPE